MHIVVRADGLAASMSDYLTRRLEADPKITIHYETEIAALYGDNHLVGISFTSPRGVVDIATRALFVMVGAAPNTGWLSGLVKTDARGFLLTGAAAGRDHSYRRSADGIFAVGDVRAGSVKRVASAVGKGSVVVSRIWNYVDAIKETAQLKLCEVSG